MPLLQPKTKLDTMTTLKPKIELLPTEDSGKLAVSSLTHITPAIIANIQGSGTISAITEDVLTESLMYLLSDFDAEIGKNKTIQRYIELSPQTRFDSTAGYTVADVGTLVAESLLAQPLAYSSLRIRRVFVDVRSAINRAVIRVRYVTEVTTPEMTGYQVPRVNRVELSSVIDADLLPVSVQVGVVADGIAGFRPIQSAQLPGYVRRASLTPFAWCQWELIVDMNKVATFYADELTESYQLRCAVNVMDRHMKSQVANRSTLVGREELAANRAELFAQYERILCNACKKIYEAISMQPATRHKLEFDKGYSVGSVV